MEIIFVRHGEAKHPGLTKNGKKQAEYLSKELIKSGKFNEFYCSNLKRAKETAKIVSKKIKVRPIIEKSLNEFKSETLKKSKSKWNSEEKKHYKNLLFFLKRITKNPNENKKVLIISHGVTNRLILSFFLKLNIRRVIPFRTGETAINSIYWNDKFKNWRLKYWGKDYHLPRKLKKKEY